MYYRYLSEFEIILIEKRHMNLLVDFFLVKGKAFLKKFSEKIIRLLKNLIRLIGLIIFLIN